MTDTEINPFAAAPAGPVDYGTFSFTLKRFVLIDLCERAIVAIPREGIPVHGCFQVRVSDKTLRLAATDMERWVTAQTEAVTSDLVSGSKDAYIPARKLLAMLHEAPEGDVIIKVTGNKAEIVVSGASWTLQLPDSSNYPALPSPDSFEFQPYERSVLLTALKTIRHAVCRDASRANLTQISFTELDGKVYVTASDGSRLARVSVPDFPLVTTLPGPALDDLVKLLAVYPDEKVEVASTKSMVAFRAGHVMLATTKRATPFPNVEDQLLAPAAENQDQLTTDTAALRSAIRRVRINSDTETAAIALVAAGDKLTVESRDKSGNTATETIPAKWGKPHRLAVVSHVFLDQALAVHPDKSVAFRLGKTEKKKLPKVLMEGGETTQVLSQMLPKLVGH